MNRVALVTGASRGVGLEVCRQLYAGGYSVVMTGLDPVEGAAAAAGIGPRDGTIDFFRMDVTSDMELRSVEAEIRSRYGRLDVIVNNAAVSPYLGLERYDIENSLVEGSLDWIRNCLDVNTLGAIRVGQVFVPFMIEQGYGRIVNVTSGSGQIETMESGWPGYRISKAALNAYTRILAHELRDLNILVNSVCPGHVKTHLGGAEAPLTPAEGALAIVWAARLEDGGPSGCLFRGMEKLSW
jgi:NAD(P)-dependent dehydrogenase (short-subunit alcohol dehydrogenase family)